MYLFINDNSVLEWNSWWLGNTTDWLIKSNKALIVVFGHV